MPYADPEKQREAQARWYQEKYGNNRSFQRREARRKALWLQTEAGQASNAKASARARVRARAKTRKARAKKRAAARR